METILRVLWMVIVVESTFGDWCGNGSDWIDNFHPTQPAVGYVVGEPMPLGSDLDRMCNRSAGGMIDIYCKDYKGEPFHAHYNRLSGDNQYNTSCTFEHGATCQTLQTNASCGDYAIKIHCSCPPLPTTVDTKVTSNSMATFLRSITSQSLSIHRTTTKSPKTTATSQVRSAAVALSSAAYLSLSRESSADQLSTSGSTTSQTGYNSAVGNLGHEKHQRSRSSSMSSCVHLLIIYLVFDIILDIGAMLKL